MKYLISLKNNYKQRRGFTLAETLLVIGIIMILLALLIPNLIQMQRNLRQKELDAKAEIIYVAAQNELAKLRAGGNGQAYGANLSSNPYEVTIGGESVCLLSNRVDINGADPSASNWMDGKADGDLLGGHWVVVFDPTTATVKEVYYADTDAINTDRDTGTEADDAFASWKPSPNRSGWKGRQLGKVGYYGGDGIAYTATNKVQLKPDVLLENGEKLILTVTCQAPAQVGELEYTVSVCDKAHENDPAYTSEMVYTTSDRTLVAVLDDVEDVHFDALFPRTTPGVPLTLKVKVEAVNPPEDYTVISGSATYTRTDSEASLKDTFNGFFANETGFPTEDEEGMVSLPAKIAWGRHLQNLDRITGNGLIDPDDHMPAGIYDVKGETVYRRIDAVQTRNISFREGSKWEANYGDRKFDPIENGILHSYDGAMNVIGGLTAAAPGGHAGLFDTIPSGSATALKNIRLEGTMVSGLYAGALVGYVRGECTITNCGVYLDQTKDITPYLGKWANARTGKITRNMISATRAGGLVGYSEGKLTITDSFASTTVQGTAAAGGLVGAAKLAEDGKQSVTIKTSYADCYITGNSVGGLAGSSVTSVSDCYAAGYLIPNNQQSVCAGLVNGTVSSIARSYTVCDLGKGSKTMATVEYSPDCQDVYYLYGGTMNEGYGRVFSKKLSLELLNVGAENQNFQVGGGTTPYRLKGQTGSVLNSYSFPHLKSNARHYGDWRHDFQSGEFVYFEKYDDGTYAFSSGDDLVLSDDPGRTLVGDGYAVALEWPNISMISIEYNGMTYSSDSANPATRLVLISGAPFGMNKYNFYMLPASAYAPDALRFYQQVTVTVGDESSTYFFNPFFADTVDADDTVELEAKTTPNDIYIRSARQLNALSKYYDWYYYACTMWKNFQQTRDIDFAAYDWIGFSGAGRPEAQRPIGYNGFYANYNGNFHKISNVGVEADLGFNVGLFGKLVEGFQLQNLYFVSDYDPDNLSGNGSKDFTINESKPIDSNETYSMGALVGWNDGTISNCAVAGHRLTNNTSAESKGSTIYTYTNSTLYAGGLVGYNSASGVITNCSAVTPEISVDSLFSSVYIGGLVGGNFNDIRSSYAIASLDGSGKTSTVYLSGFAGTNPGGQISDSYCMTSMVAAGTVNTYGFAPLNGSAKDCDYLDKGTYSFVGQLHGYDADADITSGYSTKYSDFTGRAWIARAASSQNHALTTGTDYPFRCYVKNAAGAYVHYGDWPLAPLLGEMGVFYWEKEEGGSNPGYHFSALGTLHEGDDVKHVSASTLCTSHDDGGTITDFGYGYYYDSSFKGKVEYKESDVVGLSLHSTWMPEDWQAQNIQPNSPVQNAQASLEKQMPGYTFFPYITKYTENNNEDHLYLIQGDKPVATEPVTFGTMKLTYTSSKEGAEPEPFTYKITPFFADAMTGPAQTDGSKKTRTEDPGTANNQFDIRSVQQLRYINWNTETHDCDTLVFGEQGKNAANGNFQQFPFLQYTSSTSAAHQYRTGDPKRSAASEKVGAEDNRPQQSWRQSHDLHADIELLQDDYFTPIAGMGTSSPFENNSYTNILYTWFGGIYDGQSYKIQNVNIKSPAFSVGLFGATAGATIRNVILYSDNGSAIERYTLGETRTYKTENAPDGVTVAYWGTGHPNNKSGNKTYGGTGAYFLGGLIGVAYVYHGEATGVIENCAVAGYQIVDSSTNQQGHGTANIGGLVGLANSNLVSCSAVTDIIIRCTHEYGHMYWGSFVRVGGLAGGAGAPGSTEVKVNNCYTGGSIVVSDELWYDGQPYTTLHEPVTAFGGTSNSYALRDSGNTGRSLNIFVSGLIGGSYAPNITNFTTNTGNSPDGNAKITNSYTYTSLPGLQGTIRAVSLFANQADRYDRATNITIENCYYLGSIKQDVVENSVKRDDPSTWPDYFFSASQNLIGGKAAPWKTVSEKNAVLAELDTQEKIDAFVETYGALVVSPQDLDDMLTKGDLNCLKKLLNPQGPNGGKMKGEPQPRSFAQLSSDQMYSELQSPWHEVTTTDISGNSVSGKYSFSDDPSQTGMDYPFPAVVKEGDAYVHYGAWPWPSYGAHWEYGRSTMDIFKIMKAEPLENASATATKTSTIRLTLKAPESSVSGGYSITDDTSQITVWKGDQNITDSGSNYHVYEVAPDALNNGRTAVVTLENVKPDDGLITVKDAVTGASAEVRLRPAEAQFKLLLDEPVEPDAAHPNALERFRFSVDEPFKAQIVDARWGTKKETINGVEQDVPDTMAVVVTLRALGVDTVKLKAELEKEGKYETLASCYVTITSNLEVKARTDGNEDPISWIELKTQGDSATCYCTADEFTALGVWSFSDGKKDSGSEETDTIKTILLESPVDNQANRFKVTYNSAGDISVTATYTYNYFGAELSANKVIDVRTMGYVGLSDGNRAVIRERRSDAEPQGPDGVDVPGIRPQGADLILYVPAAEGDLGDFNITWTAPEGTKITSLTTEQGYTLLETSNGYQYRGFTLRSLGSADVPNCTVSFTLKKGTTEDYTLTLEGLTAYRYQVRFDKNAAHARTVENLQAMGVTAGTVLPTNVGLISRDGYEFIGWCTQPDGAEDEGIWVSAENEWKISEDAEDFATFAALAKKENDAAAIENTITLYARWRPHTYRVIFDPNPPVENPEGSEVGPKTMEFEYSDLFTEEEPVKMPDFKDLFNEEDFPTDEWAFLNWNELFYGGGQKYEPGKQYNLTMEDNAEITLYAQWQIASHPLKLAWGEDGIKTYTIRNGAAQINLTDTPVTLGTNNWPVDSWWYVAPSGQAIQILKIETDPETGKRMGSIVSGAEAASFISQDPETGDLFFDLSDDSVVLIPACTVTTYVSIDALNHGADDNGLYLIVSEDGKNMMKTDFSNTAVSSAQYQILTENGKKTAYLIDPGTDCTGAEWTVKYRSDFDTYTLDPTGEDSQFVRYDNGPLKFRNAWDNNKHRWVYGKSELILQCEQQWSENKTNSLGCVKLGNTYTWTANGPYKCLLFRAKTVTVFNPS